VAQSAALFLTGLKRRAAESEPEPIWRETKEARTAEEAKDTEEVRAG
jgi:hypothetical protein